MTREASLAWAFRERQRGDSLFRDSSEGDRATRLDQAIDAYEAALKVFTVLDYPKDVVETQVNLAEAYRQRINGGRSDNLEKALSGFETAVTFFAKNGEHLSLAITNLYLSQTLCEIVEGDRVHNLERAAHLIEETLELADRYFMPIRRSETKEALIGIYNELGVVHATRLSGDRSDNIERGIALLEEASTLSLAIGSSILWAGVQLNLGQIYVDRIEGSPEDNFEFAIAALKAAGRIYEEEGERVDWAVTQNRLGAVYAQRPRGEPSDNMELAIAAHERAWLVLEDQGTPLQRAGILNDLGSAYLHRRLGDPEANALQAIRFLELSLASISTADERLEQARIQHNLANALARREGAETRDLHKAIAFYEDALAVFVEHGANNELRRTARNLGYVHASLGEWGPAADSYLEACDAAEDLYGISLSLTSKEFELAENSTLSGDAAYALAKAGRLMESAGVLEWGRARSLGDALLLERVNLSNVTDSELRTQYSKAVEQLRDLESMQRALGTDASSSGRPLWDPARREMQEQLASELTSVRDRVAGIVQRIRADSEKETFVAWQTRDHFSKVMPDLPVPLVFLVTTRWGSLTLVATHDRPHGCGVILEALWNENFTSADLSSLLVRMDGDAVRGGYLPAQVEKPDWLEGELDRALPVLGRCLAYPLASWLDEHAAAGAVLVSCGDLGLFPLAAVPYEGPDGPSCLLESFDIAYAPSARALGALQATGPSDDERPADPFLIGAADPPRTMFSSSLMWARVELSAVARLFPQGQAIAFYGEDASADAVLGVREQANHIHFACHGHHQADDPLRSALALAGAPLTLERLLRERSFAGVELVVASACQTGINDWNRLPDEFVGLPAGFLMAGAHSVIASLWLVDDLATALLMQRFYTCYLQGDPPARKERTSPVHALRVAQDWLRHVGSEDVLRLLEQPEFRSRLERMPKEKEAILDHVKGRRRPYAHPYYWAPWILVGGWS